MRKVVSVKAPPAVAWRVFTEQMGPWWPLAMYKVGKAAAVDAVIEPRVGRRWYERGEDETTCDWGSVLSWEPPSRLVLTADWQYDPDLKTEIEVRFLAEGTNATRVKLEHRRLDRYGARRDDPSSRRSPRLRSRAAPRPGSARADAHPERLPRAARAAHRLALFPRGEEGRRYVPDAV